MFSFTPRIRRQFLPEYCSEAVTQRCSENMQQIHRRKPMPKCDFNNFTEIALQHGCSPVHLLHIFRTPFPRNTSEWLLLIVHDDLDSCPLFLPFHLKLSHHFLVPKFVFFFFFYIFFVLLKFLLNELNKFVNLCLILCRLPFFSKFYKQYYRIPAEHGDYINSSKISISLLLSGTFKLSSFAFIFSSSSLDLSHESHFTA